MNLAPQKLAAAHQLLVELLVDGPMPVASCITIAAETGIAVRTLFEARARLPIACDRIGDGKGRPGVWRLEQHAPPPREWRQRKLQFCAGCGEAGGRRALASAALSAMRRQMRKAEISAHGQRIGSGPLTGCKDNP